ELDDTRVVLEDADTPIVWAQPAANLLSRAEDRLLQEVVDAPAVEVYWTFESLVRAVFRPGLGQRFQLHVGRITAQFAEIGLDGKHLRQAKRQLAVAA